VIDLSKLADPGSPEGLPVRRLDLARSPRLRLWQFACRFG